MGTRGCFGFRKDGVDKLTYNHFDSYPDGLGVVIQEAILSCGFKDFDFEKLKLVDQDKKVTKTHMKKYKKFMENPNNMETVDYYWLLRDCQFNLECFLTGDVKIMIDNHRFMEDSLFCEWAYIVNLDTEKLEIYRGGNKDPNAEGRYANCKPDDIGYVGVKLMAEVPFSELDHFDMEGFENEVYRQGDE